MELQERYDELDNIESTLRILIDEISNESYKEQLQEIMFQAQDEKEEVGTKLQEQYNREEREREREYWNSQF